MNSKLKKLLILFPFLYLLHDLEEIITVEKFLNTYSNIIPFQVTTGEFALAFTMLWILASIGCFKAYAGRSFFRMHPTTYLAFLVPGILLANGIGHLFQWIFFKDYVPGIVTTVFIIFPYFFLTMKSLITEKLLTFKRFLSYFIVGFILQAPLALVAHFISKLTFTVLFS
ncbi:HXXEE domain-containing protein [Bacillus sp. EB106-08-02-XG196]|uniref:HXXEE domain-containing protein n=1 Tax=Bacillus sp. EB106-08-02-XG196 TaxID=2737049 RepID=UPI00211AD5B7|nr:HXXEE domain-containing protein [Bacillus sp. EB106-08-02-XG196]